MNQFILAPTEEALAQYQRVKDGEVYWHTADFFQFDRNLETDLSVLLNVYMDALIESDAVDEDQVTRRIGILVARKLICAARQAGVSPRDYHAQFNNYVGKCLFSERSVASSIVKPILRFRIGSNLTVV